MSLFSLFAYAVGLPAMLLGSMWLLGQWFWLPWVALIVWHGFAWAMEPHERR